LRLRRILRTPERLREEARALPDEIHVRSYLTSWGTPRFLVEARRHGRALGDRDFTTLEDARAFASIECKWHGAKLVDECRKPGDA
jgi:hypothetical protein